MIDVDDLRVEFRRGGDVVTAVDGVSFRVEAGESYGLVGESGSGKSSVLRALCGLTTGWSGAVRVAGSPPPKGRDMTFHKLVQMVFQDPFGALHPRHTVDRILLEPLEIHGMENAADQIPRALSNIGLDHTFRFRYPHQLSGGQRQRIAIARAVILQPKVLLLDEPTSALDVSVQTEILNLLSDLRDRHGLTYVLVSHDLAVVAHMCSRFGVMRAGRLVEEMTVTQLRAGRPEHAYTRSLVEAAKAYEQSSPSHATEGDPTRYELKEGIGKPCP